MWGPAPLAFSHSPIVSVLPSGSSVAASAEGRHHVPADRRNVRRQSTADQDLRPWPFCRLALCPDIRGQQRGGAGAVRRQQRDDQKRKAVERPWTVKERQ